MLNTISYEYNRDNEKMPCCWKSTNDSCLPHFHSSIEIIYVTFGEVKATLNGQIYIVKEKDFLIVPSYTIHNYTTELASNSYVFTIPLDSIPSYKAMFFRKTFASLLIEKSLYDSELEHCLIALCNYSGNFYSSHEDSYSSLDETNSLIQENIIKGYTYIFLGLIIKQVGLIEIANTKITTLTQEILIYLQDNYLNYLNLDEIANHFGYSKSRFSHIFNEYFGCSLVEYINGLRCRYAIELLQEKKDTITEIALTSGFDSTRTFYRAFQKCFGCTPSQYILK